MPAKTIWPFFIRREAMTARSSECGKDLASCLSLVSVASVIVDAPSAAARIEHGIHAELGEIIRPGLRFVIIFVEIGFWPLHRIARRDLGVMIEMGEEGLVEAVAFMRRAAERRLDHRIDREERDAGL